jgi:hypothetical protein
MRRGVAALGLCIGAWASTAGDGQAQDRAGNPPDQSLATALESGMAFETGTSLPARAYAFNVGLLQTAPGVGAGTGTQIHHGGAYWALSDRLTLGLGTFLHQDPTVEPIAGVQAPFRMASNAISLSYRLGRIGPVEARVLGSVEAFTLRSTIFNAVAPNDLHTVASLHLPLAVELSDRASLSLTPSVSVFPERIGGFDFYGTVAALGLGARYRIGERWQAIGSVNLPLSGGNTIDATQAIERVPVYRLALRYSATPRVALEGFVTNGAGTTPATRILTFWPDGDRPLFGLRLQYSPSDRFAPSFRPALPALTRPVRQVQADGLVLSAAATLDPGRGQAVITGGSNGAGALAVSMSPDRDLQFDAAVQRASETDPAARALTPTPGVARWMVGGRLRVLDARAGDPVTAAIRVLGGRDFDSRDGALFASVPVSADLSERLSVTLQPTAGLSGGTEIYGFGLGARYAPNPDWTFLGEVMPTVGGNGTVWAVGTRWAPGDGAAAVELGATNAIGRQGFATLIAQDELRLTLGLRIETGLFRR